MLRCPVVTGRPKQFSGSLKTFSKITRKWVDMTRTVWYIIRWTGGGSLRENLDNQTVQAEPMSVNGVSQVSFNMAYPECFIGMGLQNLL